MHGAQGRNRTTDTAIFSQSTEIFHAFQRSMTPRFVPANLLMCIVSGAR